ncbi:unnamed protein product [Caenorhabditis sp. 36 PRJEB53466]|nr:unnamed protein product [Caenorhabditis sp. 36 PRJEB53466]
MAQSTTSKMVRHNFNLRSGKKILRKKRNKPKSKKKVEAVLPKTENERPVASENQPDVQKPLIVEKQAKPADQQLSINNIIPKQKPVDNIEQADTPVFVIDLTDMLEGTRIGAERLFKVKFIRLLKSTQEIVMDKYKMSREKASEFHYLLPDGRHLDENKAAFTHLGIDVYQKDIDCLKSPSLLNDNIIDYYCSLINRTQDHTFIIPSYALYLIKEEGKVGSVLRGADLTTTKTFLFPICLNYHWLLGRVCFNNHVVKIYDSTGRGRDNEDNRTALDKVLKFAGWIANLIGAENFWDSDVPAGIPHQSTIHDCGAFVCRYARCIAKDHTTEVEFRAETITEFREQMQLEVRKNKLSLL